MANDIPEILHPADPSLFRCDLEEPVAGVGTNRGLQLTRTKPNRVCRHVADFVAPAGSVTCWCSRISPRLVALIIELKFNCSFRMLTAIR